MIIKIVNTEFRVRWQHFNPAKEKSLEEKALKGVSNGDEALEIKSKIARMFPFYGTKCIIEVFQFDKLLRTHDGVTKLADDDIYSYNKDKGRRISMVRAIKECVCLDKEDRKLFWDKYKEVIGKKGLPVSDDPKVPNLAKRFGMWKD